VFKDRVAERLGPTVAEQPREDAGPSFETAGWIGGGTGSGKSTVARALAARHGLRMFPVDAFWYARSARLDEPELTPDEQWLGQPPEERAEAFELTSRRRMLLAMADLAQLPKRPLTLVEGPQVLPDLLPRGAPAVFLHPTKEFQRSVLERRALPPTANPRLALENRIKKDRLYAERVALLAGERGFAVLIVDGSRSAEEILATVERSLASLLVANSGPIDLQPARRWENEVVADNVGRWLASSDAPLQPPRAYPFSCECGRRDCSTQVDLALEDFRAMPRVVAPGHAAEGGGGTGGIGSVRSD
jgi:shikimate kinase